MEMDKLISFYTFILRKFNSVHILQAIIFNAKFTALLGSMLCLTTISHVHIMYLEHLNFSSQA